jgi:transposase
MTTIGIDIGGRNHAVARCRTGETRADRVILRVRQDRAGFRELDTWLGGQADPVTLVTMESSGHYWMPLAAHLRRQGVPVALVNPLAAKYFARAAWVAPSPTRLTLGASPRWPCVTSPPCATPSPAWSCAKRRASR